MCVSVITEEQLSDSTLTVSSAGELASTRLISSGVTSCCAAKANRYSHINTRTRGSAGLPVAASSSARPTPKWCRVLAVVVVDVGVVVEEKDEPSADADTAADDVRKGDPPLAADAPPPAGPATPLSPTPISTGEAADADSDGVEERAKASALRWASPVAILITALSCLFLFLGCVGWVV